MDPLPFYEEPPSSPYSTPGLAEEYPLVLTTGKRSFEFFHSEWRQPDTTSRELHPVPYFDIHPDTAAKYGIAEGQWAWIENQMGKCRQVARLQLNARSTCHLNRAWLVVPGKEGRGARHCSACSTAIRTTSSPCARTARAVTAHRSSAPSQRSIPATVGEHGYREPADLPGHAREVDTAMVHLTRPMTPSFYDWHQVATWRRERIMQ